MNRCEECGAACWSRLTRHWGKMVCPACAQGVKRTPALTDLESRQMLLKKLEAAEPFPGVEKLIGDVKLSIERLEKRMRDEAGKDQQSADENDEVYRDR